MYSKQESIVSEFPIRAKGYLISTCFIIINSQQAANMWEREECFRV